MTYLTECPACGATVCGGEVCECGYLHLDANGQVYIRRNPGERWQPEPNIVVWQEEIEPATVAFRPVKEAKAEPEEEQE